MSKKTYDFPYKTHPSTKQSLELMISDSKWLLDKDKLPEFRESFQFSYPIEEAEQSIIINQSFWEGLSWDGELNLAFYRPDPKTDNFHVALYYPEIETAVPLCSHTMNYLEEESIKPVDTDKLKACSTCKDAAKLITNPDSFKINTSNLNHVYMVTWLGKLGLEVPEELWNKARRTLFARETKFDTEGERKSYVLNYFPAHGAIYASGVRAVPFKK